jgi:hypothetical protein
MVMNMFRNISKYTFFFLLIFFITSCATTTNIIPKLEKLENISILVKGKINYSGNREYLPRTISDDAIEDPLLIIKYQYNVNYGKENIPEGLHLANLFNPLVMVGFPIGEDTLVVIGKIDIIKQSEVIKTYSAICTFEKTRSIFYQGPTFTELRKMGLLNIRDNIEAQMNNDREFLSKLNRNDLPKIRP